MRALLAALALFATALPATAEDITPLEAQGRADQRLLDIGWRLATASADLCPDTRAAIGLLLRDAYAYADPAAVRREWGQTRDIAVQGVASGSPAQLAGIARGDEIAGLNGTDPNTLFTDADRRWARLLQVNQTLEKALALYGAVGLSRPDEAEWRLDGVSACFARFEVLSGSERAASTGVRVLIGDRWMADGVGESEAAFLVAHELAHNILKHRIRRDLPRGERPSAKHVEREADRLAPWLMARAGYDPEGAVRFLERFGPEQDGPLYLGFTHDGWKSRRDAVRTQIALIETEGEDADWTRHFVEELAASRAAMARSEN